MRRGTLIVGARVVAFPDTANEYVAVEVVGGAGAGRAENFTDCAGRLVVESVGGAPRYGLVVPAHGFALGPLASYPNPASRPVVRSLASAAFV